MPQAVFTPLKVLALATFGDSTQLMTHLHWRCFYADSAGDSDT
jgi:hypothetical protein